MIHKFIFTISKFLGLTFSEVKVLGFLICMISLGSLWQFLPDGFVTNAINKNCKEDTLFNYFKQKNLAQKYSTFNGFDIDSKPEVLDFNDIDFNENSALPIQQKVKWNLNYANAMQLESISGIGEKTSGKILALRDSLNGFKNFQQLLGISGIGTKKLNEIKKSFIIE